MVLSEKTLYSLGRRCVYIFNRWKAKKEIPDQNVYGRFALISGVDNLRIEENDVANCEQSGNNKAIQVHGANGSSTGIYVRRNRIDASASDNGGIVISSSTALNTIAEIAINENEVIVGDAGATDTLGVEFFSSSGGFIQNFTARGNLVRSENATNANVFGISCGGGDLTGSFCTT